MAPRVQKQGAANKREERRETSSYESLTANQFRWQSERSDQGCIATLELHKEK